MPAAHVVLDRFLGPSRRFALAGLVAMIACLACVPAATAADAAPSGPPTWSDEFDGTGLDLTRWSYRATGPRADGVITPDAVSVANGALTIKTYTEAGTHYSGMIGTQRHGSDGFEQAYGYFEARVKFASTSGQWSAFWLQSPSIGTPLGDPANAGVEMDVAEARARCVTASTPAAALACSPASDISDRVQQALIWDGYGADRKAAARLSDPLAGLSGDSWHTWALRWTPTELTFFYDGVATWSTTGPISRRAQYVILSSEVGEFFAGSIPAGGYGSRETSSTSMQVDYVGVWASPPSGTPAAAPGTSVPGPTGSSAAAAIAGKTAPNATLAGRARQKLARSVTMKLARRMRAAIRHARRTRRSR